MSCTMIWPTGFVINKKLTIWLIILATIVLALALGLVFGLNGSTERRIVGAVVSNGRGCAEIGRQMLVDGGSAVDAAVATLICEGIMLPQSMGIGGGFIATIYSKKTRKIETLIARESAPAAAHKDMFVGQNSIKGAWAAAVPGEILGYWELHQRYGRLPWKDLFQPSIKLCKEGHWVSKFLAAALLSKETAIRNETTMSEIFVKEDGSLYKEGDYLKRPALGKTLQKIARNGAAEIYGGGETGKMFVEDIKEMGGIIREQDLKNYKVKWDDAHHVAANVTERFKLYTTPLPSSGALLVFVLNIMNHLYTNDQEIYWHRVIESYKHAYGQRTNLGDLGNDPDSYDTIKETFDKLVSQDFANDIRNLIYDDKTFDDMAYYGANFTIVEDHGTANIAVLAENGDAVTVTSTINNYFGSKLRSRKTGIILNDEMDDFSTPGLINSFGVPASPANFIKPGKRPMSSMCPAIILDNEGNVKMLVGAAGGTKITTSIAAAIIKYLILNETMEQSVNDGRLHHQLAPMRIEAEPVVPTNIRNYLAKVGHSLNISPEGSSFAALTAIGVRTGVPEPCYDRRRVGSTATIEVRNKMRH